jgi:predicted DNA-binding protein (MmcQ/YjbR family)
MIDIDWLRKVCLPLPAVTEQIQWGNDLLFKVGGKMFAVAPLEPAPVCLSFKCSDESFAELTERPQIIPAPYLARAKWVALETPEALTRGELSELLRASYQLVFQKLSRRSREELNKEGSRTKHQPSGRSGSGKKTKKSGHRKIRN